MAITNLHTFFDLFKPTTAQLQDGESLLPLSLTESTYFL